MPNFNLTGASLPTTNTSTTNTTPPVVTNPPVATNPPVVVTPIAATKTQPTPTVAKSAQKETKPCKYCDLFTISDLAINFGAALFLLALAVFFFRKSGQQNIPTA